jgi:hypothetical protein
MKVKAFNNVKSQVGACGIWCGSCIVGNGALKETTRRYKEALRLHGLQEWAPKTFDYKEFEKGLDAIQGIPACRGCLKGGGRTRCEIRACARAKGIRFCADCELFQRCKHRTILRHMRNGARKAGLFVLDQGEDRRKKLAIWSLQLKGQWPHCLLFSH